MKDASSAYGPAPFLAAWNTESQVHLIIGANSLAAGRCVKSLETGARPIIIAPDTGNLYYSLSERVENGSVQWVRRDFQDDDLTTLGRDEVDRVVDMVFVTLGRNALSRCFAGVYLKTIMIPYKLTVSQVHVFLIFVNVSESLLMYLMPLNCARSVYFLRIPTARSTLASQRQDAAANWPPD